MRAVRGGVVGKVGGDLWDELRTEVSSEDDGSGKDVIVGPVIGAVHCQNVIHGITDGKPMGEVCSGRLILGG